MPMWGASLLRHRLLFRRARHCRRHDVPRSCGE